MTDTIVFDDYGVENISRIRTPDVGSAPSQTTVV
jgi:hypothetical protein